MGTIISVVNQKGGVGKTTTTMNLVAALADQGKKCLFIDLDPQANGTSGLGLDPSSLEHGVYEIIAGIKEPADAMHEIKDHGFHVIPSTVSLAGANVELVDVERREHRLHDALQPLKEEFDYIFIDCPPSLGLLTLNGIVAADNILIPVQAEYYALEGLGQLNNTINLVKKHLKPELEVLGAVVTMYDKRYNLSSNVLYSLYEHFPNKIFRTVIPRNVRLAEAPSHGKTIFSYDPRSRGARAYERLAKELLASQLD